MNRGRMEFIMLDEIHSIFSTEKQK